MFSAYVAWSPTGPIYMHYYLFVFVYRFVYLYANSYSEHSCFLTNYGDRVGEIVYSLTSKKKSAIMAAKDLETGLQHHQSRIWANHLHPRKSNPPVVHQPSVFVSQITHVLGMRSYKPRLLYAFRVRLRRCD